MNFSIQPPSAAMIVLLAAVAALASASGSETYVQPSGYTTSKNAIDALACCPGEDTSTQARFVWHTQPGASCQFLYKKSGAAEETAIAPTSVQHVDETWPVAFCIHPSDSSPTNYVNYARHTVELDRLEPGTEYEYRVKVGDDFSRTQRFKTAGTSGSFSFLWMSDVHSLRTSPSKMAQVEAIVANAKLMARESGLDLIVFSGDNTKFGQRYDCWQEWNGNAAVSDYMFALCAGNHEYYLFPKTPIGGTTRIRDGWFLAMRNDPPNGADGIGSSYWFIRDNVMFVAMDTILEEASSYADATTSAEALKRQTNWFDRVVSAQEAKGSFQYLVVFQHYPHFTYTKSRKDENGTSVPAGFRFGRGGYSKWRDLFDRHKVDFALGSDHHNYSRSKQLRGGKVDPQGTVYMTSPEIEPHLSKPKVFSDISLLPTCKLSNGVAPDNAAIEKLMASAAYSNGANGAILFTVDTTKMTMRYICRPNGVVYDSVEVPAKRPPRRPRQAQSQ